MNKILIYSILFLFTQNIICSQQSGKKKNKEKVSCFPCWPGSSKNKTVAITANTNTGALEDILKHNALGPIILAYAGFCNRTIQLPLCDKKDDRYYPPVWDMAFRDNNSKLAIRFRGEKRAHIVDFSKPSTVTEPGTDAELDFGTDACLYHQAVQVHSWDWEKSWSAVAPSVSTSNNGMTATVKNGSLKNSLPQQAGPYKLPEHYEVIAKERPEIDITVDQERLLAIIYGRQKIDKQKDLKNLPRYKIKVSRDGGYSVIIIKDSRKS